MVTNWTDADYDRFGQGEVNSAQGDAGEWASIVKCLFIAH